MESTGHINQVPFKNDFSLNKSIKYQIRDEIRESWNRCKNYGLKSSESGSNLMLEKKEIMKLKIKKANLIEIAKPLMEILLKFVGTTGFIIALSDERGYLLEVLGEEETLEMASGINICIGSNWSERYGGTNGIGTALATKRPVQITGPEHLLKGLQDWTCSAAPIYDNNRIIGLMQMSGPSYATHLHTLGMVVAAVKAIEEQMKTVEKNDELTIVNSHLENIFYNMSDGVMIFNSDLICTNVNSAGEKILKEKSADLINQKYDSIFYSKDTFKLRNLLRKGISFSDTEVYFQSNKSENVSYLVSGDIIYGSDKKISGVILFIKSINKIKQIVNQFAGSQTDYCFDNIIGQSKEIKAAIKTAQSAADTDSTVVIQGETGTGKEMFAQSIHSRSSRKDGPFVALNCGAIPSELIDSELFGYVDGAFTGAKKGGRLGKFELANGGTLFLDEITDLKFSKQVSLLRAIQERKILRVGGNKEIPIDVRIIVATNKDLKEEVGKGLFREDLFYRLNVLTVSLPPVRKRTGDIRLLFKHFVHMECEKLRKQINQVDEHFINYLENYNWPGNVREIQNVAERVACNLGNNHLSLVDLPEEVLNSQSPSIEISQNDLDDLDTNVIVDLNTIRVNEKERKEELEKIHIINYLKQYGGNISKVAEQMGVSRTTIYRKIKVYDIDNN